MISRPLEALRCEPCENTHGQCWARVWTVRDGIALISDMAWPLARRLLPRLMERYGVIDLGGLYHGRCILIR